MWSTFTRVSTALNMGHLVDSVLHKWSIIMSSIVDIEETEWTADQLADDGELFELVKLLVSLVVRLK